MKQHRIARTVMGILVLAVPFLALAATQLIHRPVAAAAAEPAAAYAGGIDYMLVQTATNTFTPTPTNTPTSTATPSRTPTPSQTPTGTFVDPYEPNNTLPSAATYPVGSTCSSSSFNITLWPTGDVDYFRFVVKAGRAYEIRATIQSTSNLDTYLKVFNNSGALIAQNDDASSSTRDSEVTVIAQVDGYYYAEITNISPGDPANQTYCFTVAQTALPATVTPSPTADPGGFPDACEDIGPFGNASLHSACLIGPDQLLTGLNFVPKVPPGPDNDFFQLWVRRGLTYRCGTFISAGSAADTNMILYDANGTGIAGNADRDLPGGDFGSEVTWTATYDGYLFVLVGPQNPPAYPNSGLHTYELECELILATATPTPTVTPPFTSGGGGGLPTVTPFPSVTPFPTPTPIDPNSFLPTPTPRPIVQIVPLPTPGPVDSGQQTVSLDVQLYYDANQNFQAELNEGIMDVAVALYDAAGGQLLAFGTTSEAGFVRLTAMAVSGPVRVVVPFLNYAQTVAGGQQQIILRVAPRPLPVQIP
jgi:hypothetical protein